MVTKKICLLSLAIFFLLLINLNFIFSEGVVINIKDTFQQGDKIEFNYTIDLNLVGEIRYFYGIKCNNLPEELLDLKRVNSNGDKIIGNYIGIEVDKEYENCSAFLSVISPIKLEKRKTFSTVGIIEKEFNVDIDFCKSSDCNEKSKVFIKDEGKHA